MRGLSFADLLPLGQRFVDAAAGEEQRAQEEPRGRVVRVRGEGGPQDRAGCPRGSGTRSAWTSRQAAA